VAVGLLHKHNVRCSQHGNVMMRVGLSRVERAEMDGEIAALRWVFNENETPILSGLGIFCRV